MVQGKFILTETFPFTLTYLLIALIPLYLQLYCIAIKARTSIIFFFTAISVTTFYLGASLASTQCPQTDCILRLACGTAIMKSLDMFFRHNSPPVIIINQPSVTPWKYAFYLLIELRYESFNISTAKQIPQFSRPPWQEFLIHLSIFLFLQLLPQKPIIKAYGVLFSIWLTWTFLNFIFKYPSSKSPLFGPIYRSRNVSEFWTRTWHSAYTSPTRTLGYRPLRKLFGPIGGVLGGFGLMAIFHVWGLVPYVPREGLFRVFVFFMANGVACVLDYAVWKERNTWLRTVVSWIFETAMAQWAVDKCDIPDGLWSIDYGNICRIQN